MLIATYQYRRGTYRLVCQTCGWTSQWHRSGSQTLGRALTRHIAAKHSSDPYTTKEPDTMAREDTPRTVRHLPPPPPEPPPEPKPSYDIIGLSDKQYHGIKALVYSHCSASCDWDMYEGFRFTAEDVRDLPR